MKYLVVSSYNGDLSEELGEIIGLVDSTDINTIIAKVKEVQDCEVELKEVKVVTDLKFGTTKAVKCFAVLNSWSDEYYYVLELK